MSFKKYLVEMLNESELTIDRELKDTKDGNYYYNVLLKGKKVGELNTVTPMSNNRINIQLDKLNDFLDNYNFSNEKEFKALLNKDKKLKKMFDYLLNP
jgi:hypothetical protein